VSGICGWAGGSEGPPGQRRVLERMAEHLTRHDGGRARLLVKGHAALSCASPADSTDACEDHGAIAVVYGRPTWPDAELTALAAHNGLALSLIVGFREHGRAVLERLRGPFSLALVDFRQDDVLLAVDRFEICPLLYAVQEGTLVFGSSLDAVAAHPAILPEVDPQALYDYVYFHMVPGPRTVYRNHHRVGPGGYVHLRRGQIETGRYWRMQYREHERRGLSALKEEFLGLLRAGVREAAQGTGVGAFLSGGTDSSTVAGVLAEVAEGQARTYSIGFEAEGYDEMEYARTAARRFGTDHHEYYVTPQDVVEAIPAVAGAFDQPFGNASAVPTYYCARLARADGITRMLGGDGGDELFGGNARYARQRLFAYYSDLPAPLRKGLIEPLVRTLPAERGPALSRKLRSYVEQAAVPMPARMETYNLVNRIGAHRIFTDDFLDTVDVNRPLSLLSGAYENAHARTLINRMLSVDLQFTLADNDLRKVTRASELAGAEAAFPLLYDGLAEFSACLPAYLKLKGTTLRYFFKDALRGFLPDEIIHKSKHGFGLPFGVWLQTHPGLQAVANDSLHDLRARHIIRPQFLDELTSHHLSRHAAYYGSMVWVLMMLEQWFQRKAN
jgi:asparagine synthase (glutamine-hydrolysing)